MTNTETGKKLGRCWIGLPVYTPEIEGKHDPVNFRKMKEIAAGNLYSFLSAVFPDEFPSSLDGSTKGKAAIEAAREIVDGNFELDPVGREVHYVKVQGSKPDARGELRLYDSFYGSLDAVPSKFRPTHD